MGDFYASWVFWIVIGALLFMYMLYGTAAALITTGMFFIGLIAGMKA